LRATARLGLHFGSRSGDLDKAGGRSCCAKLTKQKAISERRKFGGQEAI
jgi:hypothetical protein